MRFVLFNYSPDSWSMTLEHRLHERFDMVRQILKVLFIVILIDVCWFPL